MFELISSKWKTIIETVREEKELTDVSYRTWLMPLRPVAFNKNVLTVLFPGDSASLSFVEKRYSFFLQYVIEEVTGISCSICFVNSVTPAVRSKETSPQDPVYSGSSLNTRYTFDSFVVGNNNMLAHAAALAVAETPGETYNPLFIYGGSGLGKTHLMQSIANFILKEKPETRVSYVTCENFMNELIDAIRKKNNVTTTEFREKYRNVDVLLIDDIQFISKMVETQTEVFHTFNDLYEGHKQIVLSSDRPLNEIQNLEDRLRSRFGWGLIVDIGLPDYETRMAILRKKEEQAGYNVDNEVIKYIASNIKSNIRELEGALTKVVATSRLTKKAITPEMAQEVLQDLITPDAPHELTIPYLLDTVCEHFDVKKSDILSAKKENVIVVPRQICFYLCSKLGDKTSTDIGRYFGRDHATVIYGIHKIEELVKTDESIKSAVDVLTKKLSIS